MAVHLIVSLIVLAISGLVDSGYLYWHHIKKKPLICPLNHDCNAVVESKWGSFFGIKNELWGIGYYMLIIIGALMFFINGNNTIHIFMVVVSNIALLFSLFLVYIQKYVLREYCFYCLISALINFLLFVNLLLLF